MYIICFVDKERLIDTMKQQGEGGEGEHPGLAIQLEEMRAERDMTKVCDFMLFIMSFCRTISNNHNWWFIIWKPTYRYYYECFIHTFVFRYRTSKHSSQPNNDRHWSNVRVCKSNVNYFKHQRVSIVNNWNNWNWFVWNAFLSAKNKLF